MLLLSIRPQHFQFSQQAPSPSPLRSHVLIKLRGIMTGPPSNIASNQNLLPTLIGGGSKEKVSASLWLPSSYRLDICSSDMGALILCNFPKIITLARKLLQPGGFL